MTKRFWVGLALLLVIPGLMLTMSCAKKKVVSEPAAATTAAEEDAEAKRLAEEAAMRKAMDEQRIREERLREEARARREGEEMSERAAFENEHIYYNFDESTLLPDAKSVLAEKAQWLKANPNVSVIIEGHCDERGTNEYNMALGDRRARSAKSYLVVLGIAPERLTTISYGEERPLDPGHNESAWAKNRRAQFVIE